MRIRTYKTVTWNTIRPYYLVVCLLIILSNLLILNTSFVYLNFLNFDFYTHNDMYLSDVTFLRLLRVNYIIILWEYPNTRVPTCT